MRTLFSHYYKLNEEQLAQVWKECIFSFDTNVLLDIYRYTPQTRERFLEILNLLSDRIWIPYQVAAEFHKNRQKVILSQSQPYQDIRKMSKQTLNELKSDLENLNLKGNRPHPFIVVDDLMKIIDSAQDELLDALTEMESQHPNYLSSDELLKIITDLFSDKVGSPYSQEELDRKYDEIKFRYSVETPPGYEDLKEKKAPQKGDPDPKAYGDAVLWMQLIDFMESQSRPLIFVTGDVKPDWWLRIKGKTIGARPELRKEMLEKANAEFYMYQTHRFMDLAQQFFELERQDEAIDEIRELGWSNRELDSITSNWSIVLRYVGKKDEGLRAYLSVAKPLDFNENTLTLGFDFPTVKEKFEKGRLSFDILSEAVSVVTGIKRINIQTVLIADWNLRRITIFEEDNLPF